MDKNTVIRHFGSGQAVTKALNLSSGAVSLWGAEPPLLQQYRLARLTGDVLEVNDPLFEEWHGEAKKEDQGRAK